MIKKIKTGILVMLVYATALVVIFSGSAIADGMGPAPNSGDSNPDGSGFDSPMGPNYEEYPGEGHGCPAPNSGDGNPDGPGW